MKRVLWGIEAVLILIMVLLLTNHLSNEWMIWKYSHNYYSENNLSFLGFWQPYVSAYNQGNVHYQKGEYEEAVVKYEEALMHNPSQKYDCKIRINDVLAKLATFDENKVTIDNYDESLDYLESAKQVLCEKGCADPTGSTGHNYDAQTLREDIDACINRLGVKVSFVKNDENNQPLPGATLQVLNAKGEVMYEWISADTPYRQIRFIKGEKYIYRELLAPEGYMPAKDIVFTVNEDGSVSYDSGSGKSEDGSENEVVMIDAKDGQSGGENQPNQNPNQGKDEENGNTEEDKEKEEKLKKDLQGLQQEGQKQRNDEINDNSYEYEYYDGATW